MMEEKQNGTTTPKDQARRSLHGSILKRRASLSEAEQFFLHALLIEEPKPDTAVDDRDDDKKTTMWKQATNVLNDDMLFMAPPLDNSSAREREPQKPRRPSILGLWKAHQDGVHPKDLIKKGSLSLSAKAEEEEDEEYDEDAESFYSDHEVRPERRPSMPRCSLSGSSWGEDNHQDHFDAWEVLKDEYAEDFGFDYSDKGISCEDVLNHLDTQPNTFRILGTSADDTSSQPHVLSPPLMDALMSFLPDSLVGENYWLKFSLIRDGASLATLKQYVRASKYTILAIETPAGEVFGSFTSSPWRNNFSFFGSEPAFVWKMRHSRRTKCSSLFDQAQLESEIDVYMATGANDFVQVCRHNSLAVGGDDGLARIREERFSQVNGDRPDISFEEERNIDQGFAFALEDDLLLGTTSPSSTFRNPALCGACGDKSETFEVANLEVWTFTPAFEVKSAERLEMTQFFIEESTRSVSSPYAADETSPSGSPFTSQDLVQEEFYRRVGQDPESDERRDRWQYMNMMNATDAASRGLGASPRFGM